MRPSPAVRVPRSPCPALPRLPSSQRRREPYIAHEAPSSRDPRRLRVEALAEWIYTTHRRRLLTIARRNCSALEDAEEALQDAFIIFIDRFDPDGGAPPLAWITLTLKRECWARYRREQRPQRGSGELSPAFPVGADPDTVADQQRRPDELAELHDGVRRARSQLAELKPDERRALGLLALGYSYREIGELTGWTHTKINRCVSEGRAALREAKRKDEDAEPS